VTTELLPDLDTLIVPKSMVAFGCESFQVSKEVLIDKILWNPIELPLNGDFKEMVRLIPPQTVGGQKGPQKSDVLVIGKMPNMEEQNRCQLHCGELGKMWQPFVREKGLAVDNWAMYNVVPYRVPDHMMGSQLKVGYVNDGLPLLREVFARVQPKYVLLFGAEALKGVLRLFAPKRASKDKFTNCRGSIIDINGMKCICCLSPSSVMKEPEQKDQFESDLALFCRTVQSHGESAVERVPDYQIIRTFADLRKFVDDHKAAKYTKYALDCEWGANYKLRIVQLAWKKNTAVVISLFNEKQENTELGNNIPKVMELLAEVLKRDDVGIIGHNGRGDVKILRKYGLDLLKQFVLNGFDTMLAYHLVPGNETLEKQLELVAYRMLGIHRYDKPLRDWLVVNGVGEAKVEEVGYSTIPDDIINPYAAWDAIVTFELEEVIAKLIKDTPGLEFLYREVCHPVNVPVLEMEETGVYIDKERLLSVTDLFVEKIEKMKSELQALINWPTRTISTTKVVRGKEKTVDVTLEGFNPDSPTQVAEILFGICKKNKEEVRVKASPADAIILNLMPVKATDKAGTPWTKVIESGKTNSFTPSTDTETLGILENSHPFITKLKNYKIAGQVVKNFMTRYTRDEQGNVSWPAGSGIGGNIGPDDRLHTSFRITLETGRYSTSPNCQNFPKRREKDLYDLFKDDNGLVDPRYKSIRSVITATPGKVLLEADWNQAELWTLGYISGDAKYLKVLAESDLHTVMTLKMFKNLVHNGKRLSEYSVAEYNKLRKKDKALDSYRIAGKTVNFGVPYSRGAIAIAREVQREGLDCTPQESKGWINDFYTEFVDVAMFIANCKASVLNPGFIQNPWGRYRVFPECTDQAIVAGMQREAVNFPIQSTVGDAMSMALCNLYAYRQANPSIDFRIMLSVHDAILVECDGKHVERMVREVFPLCMCDGLEVPKIGLRYSLGEIDIQVRWGEKADPQLLEDLGVARELCGYEK